MLTLQLALQIPSGKNQIKIRRNGARYPTPQFKAWRTIAAYELKRQVCGTTLPLTGPVKLTVRYQPGDRITRDLDGMVSALFHLLTYLGILKDDSQVKALSWKECPVRPKEPFVEMEIEGL